jgi:predicted ATPase
VPYFLGLLGEVHARAGEPVKGLGFLSEALEHVGQTGERWFEAELHRRTGEILLDLPEPDEAEATICFRRAVEVARRQDAKMWELRVATRLARLWAGKGDQRKAHDLLAPIYGWFTEGFETADLKEAKALLAELQ